MEDSKLSGMKKQLEELELGVRQTQIEQLSLIKELNVDDISSKLDRVHNSQDQILKSLNQLRGDLIIMTSRLCRTEHNFLGNTLRGLNDRLIREDTCGPGYLCVLEATPWQIPPQLQEMIDVRFEGFFLLYPWIRDKKARDNIKNILKLSLENGPQFRSTVNKIMYEKSNEFLAWRAQIKEKMFSEWEKVQKMNFTEAAIFIFQQFKKPRRPEEVLSTELYAEHMIEVGQYLIRKRIRNSSKELDKSAELKVNTSKFWYEVNKKVTDLDRNKSSDFDPTKSSYLDRTRSFNLYRRRSSDLEQPSSSVYDRTRSSNLDRSRSSDLDRSRSSDLDRTRSSDLYRTRNSDLDRTMSSDLDRTMSSNIDRTRSWIKPTEKIMELLPKNLMEKMDKDSQYNSASSLHNILLEEDEDDLKADDLEAEDLIRSTIGTVAAN
ncbi:uncharacterized protein LOC111701132 [Eurytemora carolleeae]|uniref:uncharacterized protein LOC111701132 n=1 Tax=Eurytemora carolleeae TaxID=1294199 RepID=UPI000C770BB1|nr:uncharacterized protein LOC111701132 [Eurytemora carolleeae]|eukprot:XP_023328064.1 uncharacterized protein LOC111701132 [Eurytemora affinis]